MTTFLAPVTQALLQDNFSDNTSLDPNERSYPTGPASYYGRTQIMLSLTRLGIASPRWPELPTPRPAGILGYEQRHAAQRAGHRVCCSAGEQNDYFSQPIGVAGNPELVPAGDGDGQPRQVRMDNGRPTWEGFGRAGTNWQMA
jgi:hypothetical protein